MAVFVEPLAAAMRIMEQLPSSTFDINQRVLVMGAGRLGHLVALALATTPCQLTVSHIVWRTDCSHQ
jgi:threonine dehydrogenase-like Zn-dependent dehydrogenase